MAPIEEIHQAMVNRSIRTIKAELEYLCDASVITPSTLSELLSAIPERTAMRAPISVGAVPSALPTAAVGNINLNHNNSSNLRNEKQQPDSYYQPPSNPPPPSYNAAPPPQANWPPLAEATALYAYTSSDAGDLALQPNDHITVTEYMNAEWWKGKSSRTGQEGIFPRSYVKVIEKSAGSSNAAASTTNNYGNAPLDVSGMGNGQGQAPGKLEAGGKKFGKKLGNAAIFGAGATIGGNIVNSIF